MSSETGHKHMGDRTEKEMSGGVDGSECSDSRVARSIINCFIFIKASQQRQKEKLE